MFYQCFILWQLWPTNPKANKYAANYDGKPKN